MPTPSRMAKPSVRHTFVGLAFLESMAMLSCLFLGINLSSSTSTRFIDHLVCLECITFVLIVSLSMAAMGMYHARQRDDTREQLARLFISFVLASVAQSVIFYFIPYLNIDPVAIIVSLTLSFVLVCLIRYSFISISSTALIKRNVLVLGAGEKAKIIEERMRRSNDRRGFKLAGYIPLDDDEISIEQSYRRDVDLSQLQQYAEQHRIDELVVAADQRRGALPMDELYRCRVAGIHVTDIATFIEAEAGKIPLNLLNPSWMIYSRGYRSNDLLVRALKRIFDVLISLTMLAITLPIMIITALLIMIESAPRTPIFYWQERVGLGGQPFRIYKFRSMRPDAEANGAVWARKDDDRVTVIGSFIRKYRIDELPQLVNVLSGDMSFIGPRPERPEFVDSLTQRIPYYGDRHMIKPGLTGWAQVCYSYGGSEDDAMEKLQYDLYYIKNFSFLLDTIILIETIEVVLFGKGAR